MTVLYGNLIYVRILFHLDRAVFCEGIGPEDLPASGNDQFASRRLTEGKKPGHGQPDDDQGKSQYHIRFFYHENTSGGIRNMHITSRAGEWVKLLPAILITVLIIITQTGCGEKDPVSKSDFCLDTTCDIKIYDMKTGEASEILDGAFEEIDRYENLMSKTIEGSDVYKINHAQGQPVEVSKDTLKVIELGIEMGDLSGGMFDITIGKVLSLWNFTGDDPKVPEQADLTEALKTVNYKQIDINDSAVSMKDPQAQLDLGGVAKGYIADRICDYLKNQGVEKAVINLGGNVAVLGEKAKDTPWNIAIERPYSDRTEMMGYVSVKDATVVTSGIYERKFEQDGVLYHHVLDPRSGYPVDTDLEAVTIRAARGNSGFCDGLSTVCLMLGRDKAQALIQTLQEEHPEMKLEAAFIDKNDAMTQTDGMDVKKDE